MVESDNVKCVRQKMRRAKMDEGQTNKKYF